MPILMHRRLVETIQAAVSQIEVLVHEQVADAIKSGDFDGVILEPVAEA